MPKDYFYPNERGKRVELMEHFAAHIGDFPGKFSSLAADISAQATDAVVARKLYNYQQAALAHGQAATWTYTAVYLLDDTEVGRVSAPVVVAM